MTITHKLNRDFARIVRSVLTAAALLMVVTTAAGQTVTKSGTDQMTPANLAAGSPAGAYALSGFDNVSLFNGNLNFRLPLHVIAGRGGAGYTMMLALNSKSWHVKRTSSTVNGEETNITYTPTRNSWQGYEVGYGPGTLIGRRSGEGTRQPVIAPCTSQHPIYEKTLTRLSFTGSDGTEYEFVDQLTMGKPYLTQQSDCGQLDGFVRGRVFVTTKGEAATFISDVAIRDKNPVAFGVSLYNATGYMLLRDGTRYRIDNALVSWIQDRNGNRITFPTYDDASHRVTQIIDSLNRQVNITYDNSAATDCTANYDEITFTGFGLATRSIKIWHQCLSSALRSDQPFLTYTQLFPPSELNGSGNIQGAFNPRMVTAVTLPDGRQYQFLYNSYAEVARVVLPTGGAYEYDYTSGSGVGDDSVTGVDREIYRRVIERRVLPDGTNIEGRTRYAPTSGIGNFSTVDHWDASAGVLLAHDEHTFETSGGPLLDGQVPYMLLYPDVLDGMETQVEAKDTSGGAATSLLRREGNSYVKDTAPWSDNGFQWEINARLTATLTSLLDVSPALVSQRLMSYDQYFNPATVSEYGFGVNGQPGSLVRQTTTTYLQSGYDIVVGGTGNPDPVATIHIRNLPTQRKVLDSGGVLRAQTDYEYDIYTTSDNFHAALQNEPGITGLDSSFTTTHYTRGNVTRTTRSLIDTSGMVTGSIIGYAQYDIAGNVVKVIDPRSTSTNIIATSFDFSDAYGTPNSNGRGNEIPLPGELPGTLHTYAFATKVTNAMNQASYIQYNYYLGRPVNSEDANGIVSSASYNDLLDRPTGIDLGIFSGSLLQSHTSFVYGDSSHMITTHHDQTTLNDGVLSGTLLYDGLGRTTDTQQSEPDGGVIHNVQQYDAMGRVKRITNPYRAMSELTYGYADTVYDALGRVRTLTTYDGAVVRTDYSGGRVLVTDQAGKQRISQTDGLGRLTDVWEITAADSATEAVVTFPGYPGITAGYRTTYNYDVLDDLTLVTQKLGATPKQTRTFSYDSLKRLTQAINPESNTVNYTYDENSNLKTKQDARPITTTYSYDALNRVIKRTYSDSTPEVNYYYDNQSLPATKPPNFTQANSTGRLIAVTCGGVSSSAGSYQSYDQLGRVTSSYQQTDSINYGFGYGYNLASEMTSETYPSGRQVVTEYDSAGRAAGIRSALVYYAGATASDAANRIQYAPHGGVSLMMLGNGKWEHTNFNNRLQPTQIGLGTSGTDSSTLKLDYEYTSSCQTGNNGNVMKQTINAAGLILTQNYCYDTLNRLSSASENSGASWSQTYGFDRWGNRWVSASSGYTLSSLTPTGSGAFNTANNRLVASGYDNAGNQTGDALSRSFTYDAENRQLTFNTTGGQYSYDGDGHRVKKVTGSVTTVFVYNAMGELTAEYTNDTAPPAGGGGTSYLTSDHLGSTRLVTSGADFNGNVTVKARYDYLPFGEEIPSSVGGRSGVTGYGGADSTRQKFTQKERDNESGLDYFLARYYSSAQGRFTSAEPLNIPVLQKVDPKQFSLTIANPKNWNAYGYSHNDPVNKLDPDGFLTIVIPGTWNNNKEWKSSEFVQMVSATFNEDAIVIDNNNMGNTPEARAAVAQQLKDLINNHEFAPGEQLNIVAHSHGGNVAFEATQEGLDHKIDTLVTLGTPIRSDYQPDESQIGLHLQVYSNNDKIQTHGGPGHYWAASLLGPIIPGVGPKSQETGPAGRTLNLSGVKNLDATQYASGHSKLWKDTQTWQQVVVPELKK